MTVMTLYAGCVQVEGSFEFGDSRDRVKHFAFDYCYDSAVDRSDNAEYASQELVSTLGEAGQAFVVCHTPLQALTKRPVVPHGWGGSRPVVSARRVALWVTPVGWKSCFLCA